MWSSQSLTLMVWSFQAKKCIHWCFFPLAFAQMDIMVPLIPAKCTSAGSSKDHHNTRTVKSAHNGKDQINQRPHFRTNCQVILICSWNLIIKIFEVNVINKISRIFLYFLAPKQDARQLAVSLKLICQSQKDLTFSNPVSIQPFILVPFFDSIAQGEKLFWFFHARDREPPERIQCKAKCTREKQTASAETHSSVCNLIGFQPQACNATQGEQRT